MNPTALVRTRAVPALLAAAMLAAMLGTLPQHLVTFLVPAGAELPAGARVLQALPVADALVVTGTRLPAGAVPADEALTFKSLLDTDDTGVTLDSGVAATFADLVWPATTGDRAVVALIDTGVAPVPALADAMAGEIDFSGSGGGDGYGHGTFMASLIAARGPLAPGAAPGAGVLSLKVADDDGTATLATVMSALQWLYGPGRASGVRIATLALGVDADSPAGELLDLATERLAADGVLLVTAAGNEGADVLTSPATSTGTFSVGAYNDATGDVAAFSGSGMDRVGVAQPDLHAPGVAIVGHMDAASHIAVTNPGALVDGHAGLIRGSGTSMATALTAGVAALASSARPDLDATALAEALRAGDGRLDAVKTLDHVYSQPHHPGANGLSAEGLPPASANGQARGKGHDEAHAASVRWHSVRWHSVRWHSVRWHDETWAGERWDSVRWHDKWGAEAWGSVRWHSVRWHSVRWHGTHWGDEDWEMARWGSVRWHADAGWSGYDYEGEDWASVRWASVRWASVRWASVRWASVRWASVRWAWLDA